MKNNFNISQHFIYGGNYMNEVELTCPICGSEMIKRHGPKVDFWGCLNFPRTNCTGKRDMQGQSWGCEDEPFYLNDEGSKLFSQCISDGFTYDEAVECATEWQRLEEKDRWK